MLAGAVLGAAALLIFYSANPSLDLDLDRPVPGNLTGLYDEERAGDDTYAWSRAHVTLQLNALDRRREWACVVRLMGGRADPSTLPEVVFSVDGIVATRRLALNTYDEVNVLLPVRPGMRGARVTMDVSNTFTPTGGDTRALGVIVDRWSCAPVAGGLLVPPRGVWIAATAGGAAFGAALGVLGLGTVVLATLLLLVSAGQALLLTWNGVPYASFADRALWLVLACACLPLLSLRRSMCARAAVSWTAVVLYLKLLALLHPDKALIDAVFHAHRVQWILDGKYFFTQPMPSGVQFPYAIGLYVVAAPFSWLTDDLVTVLRAIISTAEATGGVLVYLMAARVWNDRQSGVAAAVLFSVMPLPFVIIGNANMTNVFAQALALAAVATAVVWPPVAWRRGAWLALTAITAAAMLSHISTFTLLSGTLAALAVLYRWRGDARLRIAGVPAFAALATAAIVAVILYYSHFADAFRSAASVSGSSAASTGAAVSLWAKVTEAAVLVRDGAGWPLLVLGAAGLVPWLTRARRSALDLALVAWAVTFVVFVASVVVAPVEQPFLRYAAEFISRVIFTTYPALILLGGLAVGAAWRRRGVGRVTAVALVTAAVWHGANSWLAWLR